MGRAKVGGEVKGSAARPQSRAFLMAKLISFTRRTEQEREEARVRLEAAAGDPRGLARTQLLDDLRKMLVQPVLEDRAQHVAHRCLERTAVWHRRGGRADRRERGKRLAA